MRRSLVADEHTGSSERSYPLVDPPLRAGGVCFAAPFLEKVHAMSDAPMKSDETTDRQKEFRLLSDHLSNERTYLAYLRTAVSLMSFGIAINRFSIFLETSNRTPESSRPAGKLIGSEQIGIGMVAIGMALLVWAAVHYYLVLRQIERQDFRPRPRSIFLLTALILASGISGLTWLFLG